MFFLYNALALLLSPLLLLALGTALLRAKYRSRVPARLGFGLRQKLQGKAGANTVWVHALSVGEVTSAQPLLRGLRTALPEARLILSVGTRSGEQVARERLADYCDVILAAPYDLYPVISRFIQRIKPRVFILVETDFWPNWLHMLERRGIPAYLVNGRISAASYAKYQRFVSFFAPMFRCFTGLCMQTKADAANMEKLGLDPARIHTLGNLKFDAAGLAAGSTATSPAAKSPVSKKKLRQEYGFDPAAPLFICGSTHSGEEELLLPAFAALLKQTPHWQLLLAPRQIERAGSIAMLAARHGIHFRRRSLARADGTSGPALLLDTLGELADCYAMADLACIGGSLVPAGGHNPVEAAAAGVAACFGPHMDDFSEIAAELVTCGGALQVGKATLAAVEEGLRPLMLDEVERRRMALAAGAWLEGRRGVIERHLALIMPHFQ